MERQALANRSLTYGEVEFAAFVQILRRLPRKGVFVDLGSGSGRAVLLVRAPATPASRFSVLSTR